MFWRTRVSVCLAWGWLLVASPFLLGCGPACWLKHKADGRPGGTGASFGSGSKKSESLLPEVSSLGWGPSQDIGVAKNVEGMTEFVNGAAEILWEKGVRKMAFQSFGGPGEGDSAEAFRYEFSGQDLAREFWRENCLGPAGESRGDGARSGTCEISDATVSQAFFWTGSVVLEVRLYGDSESREALLRHLDSVYRDSAGLAGGEGDFSP